MTFLSRSWWTPFYEDQAVLCFHPCPRCFLLQLLWLSFISGSSHEFLWHKQCFSCPPLPLHEESSGVRSGYLKGCAVDLTWKPSIQGNQSCTHHLLVDREGGGWHQLDLHFQLRQLWSKTNCFNKSSWTSAEVILCTKKRQSHHTVML
jgi:hypothetical protein